MEAGAKLPAVVLSVMSLAASYASPRAAAIRLRALVRGNEFFLIPLACVIGVATGLVVTAMSEITQIAHTIIYGIPLDVRLSATMQVHPAAALAAPTLGGLLLGIMEWLRQRWRIRSPVDPIEANALKGGRLSFRDSIIVSTQTVISNGCGASVGLEAGYTQFGAGIASLIGRIMKLRRHDLRLMVGCGAAGAIAAAFGAPLTGAFFGWELIVGVYSIRSAAPILTAAISAALTARTLGGAPYLIEVPPISAIAAEQYLPLLLLALLTGMLGISVIYFGSRLEHLLNRLSLPVWIRPAIGGLCVGAMAIVTPQVLAAGHGAMITDIARTMSAPLIVTIIALKLSASLISLASGFRGGLFFASLFVGCLVGKLYAMGFPLVATASEFALDPTTSMLTGMATLAVAIVGGPLTMSFLVLETTRNLEVTAGVLAACLVANVFVRTAFGHSFSTWRLHLRGETIKSASDVGWLRSLTVSGMMRTDIAVVAADASIADCRRDFPLGSRSVIFIVDEAGAYRGLVPLLELFSGDYDLEASEKPVGEIAKHADSYLLPSMNIKAAMAYFDRTESEVLAVVESADSPRIVGMLSEATTNRRYVEELGRAARGVLDLT